MSLSCIISTFFFIDTSLILLVIIIGAMAIAYVLLNCELGHEADIINELKKLPGVNDVEGCYGVYDMIVKISSDSMDKLKETITWHIRKIDKIKSTLTLIVIEGQGSHQV